MTRRADSKARLASRGPPYGHAVDGRPQAPAGSIVVVTRISLLVLLLAALLPGRSSAGEASAEARIKAAIVYNLARVVTWPEGALAGEAFLLDVAGRDLEGPAFETLAGKEARGRSLRVRTWNGIDVGQIVFVARSEAGSCRKLLASLAGQPVLTVSEVDGFCEEGGIVQLVRRQNKIQMRVNRAAAEAAGLQLSSQLLKVAELVEGKH